MTSPDPQKASTSSHASSSAVPTQPHRPLHAFWSNSSSSQPLLPTPAPTKRKRRKADDTKSQAKLLGMHDTGWSIGAEEDGANVSETSNTASVKATGRKQGAEEAERKEMAKRMKQQAAAAKKAAKMSGARKKGEAEQGEEVSLADDLVRVPGAQSSELKQHVHSISSIQITPPLSVPSPRLTNANAVVYENLMSLTPRSLHKPQHFRPFLSVNWVITRLLPLKSWPQAIV